MKHSYDSPATIISAHERKCTMCQLFGNESVMVNAMQVTSKSEVLNGIFHVAYINSTGQNIYNSLEG